MNRYFPPYYFNDAHFENLNPALNVIENFYTKKKSRKTFINITMMTSNLLLKTMEKKEDRAIKMHEKQRLSHKIVSLIRFNLFM